MQERAKKRRRSSSAGQLDRNLPRAAERLAPRRAEGGQAPAGQGDEEGRLAALRRQLEARFPRFAEILPRFARDCPGSGFAAVAMPSQ